MKLMNLVKYVSCFFFTLEIFEQCVEFCNMQICVAVFIEKDERKFNIFFNSTYTNFNSRLGL